VRGGGLTRIFFGGCFWTSGKLKQISVKAKVLVSKATLDCSFENNHAVRTKGWKRRVFVNFAMIWES